MTASRTSRSLAWAGCPLHPAYSQLTETVKAWAQRSTLADAGPFTRLLLDAPSRV